MRTLFILCMVLMCACQPQPKKDRHSNNPSVTIRTNKGNIELELYQKEAPETVKNFLRYVDEKYYDHTIFHRVIDGFMIQGGGFTTDMNEKRPKHEPIRNEADNKIANQRGTIAMARTSEVHSASSQFFINVADNDFLNFRNPTPSGYGYCVFGKVTSGMDVIDKIKAAKTGTQKGHQNVPVEPIEIREIVRSS